MSKTYKRWKCLKESIRRYLVRTVLFLKCRIFPSLEGVEEFRYKFLVNPLDGRKILHIRIKTISWNLSSNS